MEHDSSKKTGSSPSTENGSSIELGLPIRETGLFKHGASPNILNFLSDNPDIDLSIRQLSRITPRSERATREAVNVLETNDLVETFHRGNARRVRINRSRLHRADDPIRAIPQVEYQLPVRIARRYLEDELEGVKGIILFGSIARGEADRQSDIDLWVLVDGDLMAQRHGAAKLSTHLEGLKLPTSIGVDTPPSGEFSDNWPSYKARIESGNIDSSSGERYSFQTLVETPQSVLGQKERIDATKLFSQGITLHSTETLERVKVEVLRND